MDQKIDKWACGIKNRFKTTTKLINSTIRPTSRHLQTIAKETTFFTQKKVSTTLFNYEVERIPRNLVCKELIVNSVILTLFWFEFCKTEIFKLTIFYHKKTIFSFSYFYVMVKSRPHLGRLCT
jgi:hypothetical protein